MHILIPSVTSDTLRRYFKCIKPILPRQKRIVFYMSKWKTLRYGRYELDDPYHDYETGFIGSGHGDSGSPYWMKVKLNGFNEKPVHAVIAIVAGNFVTGKPEAFYMDSQEFQCRGWATKVTPDISKWVMDWHNKVK